MAVTLQSLVGVTPKFEKAIGGQAGVEGVVHSRRGYLLFSDVPARRIMKWEGGELTAYRTDSNGATGLSFDHEGRLLACEADRVTRTEKDGSITVLADNKNGSSDIVYSIDGSIYFSDRAAVWLITTKGAVRTVSNECQRPHGIALSPTQQKIYISDSSSGNVRVHEVMANGSLGSGHVFAAVAKGAAGLKTDEDGNVWAAAPSGIWVFDSAGSQLGTVPLGETPAGCCWGEGFRDLYVTAGTSVYRIATKALGTRTY